MKKIIAGTLLFAFVGCASINIPSYIQDKNPYERTFYASFENTRDAVLEAFKETGWSVERETKPATFERERDLENQTGQTLIFSDPRQTSFFLGTRYSRINVYIRGMAEKETEVEIRYLKLTSVVFSKLYGYKNKSAVDHLFKRIEDYLNSKN